jgi:hypothetical protein
MHQSFDEMPAREPPPPTESMRHYLPLRHDFTMIVDLPRDLTMKEALRIARFMQAIAFD